MPSTDIKLGLPGRAEYGRVARVGAAHLAHRRGFNLDEIDDLRLAIDEAAIMLLGPAPRPGRIDVIYRVDEHVVEVELTSVLDDDSISLPTERTERFGELTDGLVDECEVDREARRVRMVKRHIA
ncbi:MAG: ATP-binding protein [Acidimicrobiia bacterium]|nr:ATP-binding protein [Acidimicrobiia bacterium]